MSGNYFVSETDMKKVANAIRISRGTSDPIIFPEGFVREINQIKDDDVRWLDYDGTVLAACSAGAFADLIEMPKNPQHEGLISQGWNWSLSEAKTYVAEHGFLDIGQMYITDDGKTRLYITVQNKHRLEIPFYWKQTIAEGVSIDWGDGSDPETYPGTGNKNTTHTYSRTGDYVITLSVANGCELGLGNGTSGTMVFKGGDANKVYSAMLNRAELGSGITELTDYAFYYASNLKSVTVPKTVTKIKGSCLYGSGIESFTFPNTITTIGGHAFHSCSLLKSVSVPNNSLTTNLGQYIFNSCSLLERANAPFASKIEAEQYNGCTKLSRVAIPSTVTEISSYTFTTTAISSIKIPTGVTQIGSYAFYNCRSLGKIELPNTITSIGQYAFSGCYAVEELIIPSGSIYNNVFSSCRGLKKVTINGKIQSTADYVFQSCASLREVVLGGAGTHVSKNAFYTCTALEKITLCDTIKTIMQSAFSGCRSLMALTIPSGVTSIEANAFYNCNALTEIHILAADPPTLSSNSSITGLPADCKIYVPYGTGETYKAADYWSARASYIFEDPEEEDDEDEPIIIPGNL